MRLMLLTVGPMLASLTLFVANKFLGWADELLKTAELLRRASDSAL